MKGTCRCGDAIIFIYATKMLCCASCGVVNCLSANWLLHEWLFHEWVCTDAFVCNVRIVCTAAVTHSQHTTSSLLSVKNVLKIEKLMCSCTNLAKCIAGFVLAAELVNSN